MRLWIEQKISLSLEASGFSSVELENELMSHPGIAEAAVIGVSHPRWSERPLACVVRAEGSDISSEEVIDFLRDRVARWQLPDAVEFIAEVPNQCGQIFKERPAGAICRLHAA